VDSRLTIVANALRQPDTQDPLGITWGTFQRDPRACEVDAGDTASVPRCFAERYNTRKSIDHEQVGLTFEQQVGDDRLHVTAYGGNRQVIQYQAFSKGFQAPPSHSGGVVDFDRDFSGLDVNWQDRRSLAGGVLRTTIGMEYGASADKRKGFENFVGNELGVKGQLRRDETDDLSTLDPYLQSEWQGGPWVLTGGLRHTRMNVEVRDHFPGNGNDSGSVAYERTTPMLSALYKLSPTLNVYASAARGFETPTLNELFYSGSGGGFNFRLNPATSLHVEAGAKAIIGADARIDAAIFQVRTHDELVVDSASGGRTSYRNAGSTLRQGMELSLAAGLAQGLKARVAATVLRAIYDDSAGTVRAGSRLPGVPSASAYGELAWNPTGRAEAALEAFASAKAFPDDANTAQPAPGYAVFNLRAQARQDAGKWTVKEFARLNNLFDRNYVGSLIVGDSNQRYYEPAPGRHWLIGLSAQYRFQ
jgi:iron complex outermembrane receptor protein